MSLHVCTLSIFEADDPSVVATPGRMLHLMTEMSLDMRTVDMVVYDEADRRVCSPTTSLLKSQRG